MRRSIRTHGRPQTGPGGTEGGTPSKRDVLKVCLEQWAWKWKYHTQILHVWNIYLRIIHTYTKNDLNVGKSWIHGAYGI